MYRTSGRFDRIVLIIQTHADKDRGDLFYCGDGDGPTSASAEVSNVSGKYFSDLDSFFLIFVKFFEVVIGQELREFISGRKYSLMIMAACGSVVNIPDALEQLRDVVETYVLLTVTIQGLTTRFPIFAGFNFRMHLHSPSLASIPTGSPPSSTSLQ